MALLRELWQHRAYGGISAKLLWNISFPSRIVSQSAALHYSALLASNRVGKDLSRNGNNRRMEFLILLGEYPFYGDGGKSEGTADEDLGGKRTYTSPTWRGGGGVVCPKDRMRWNPQ